jgi:murein DD-endopeptidase MepM/ murein hydrolase activator NlpD
VAAACTCAGVASAASGGGGIATGDPPRLTGVICIDKCAGERIAAAGSRVHLEGSDLADVQKVKFAADQGRISVAPSATGARAVEAKVPSEAVTGTVKVESFGSGAETPRDEPLKIVLAGQIPDVGDFRLTSAEATPRTTYYDARRAPSVSYLFQGGEPTDVRIEVVDRDNGDIVRTWIEEGAEPNARNSASWNGRDAEGKAAPNGEYRFRIGNAAGGGLEATADSRFGFYDFRFPIAARHGYGDGFGAGRGHQGQDVFAKCGTTLRAARGGRVQWNKVHSSAGNYLVIDGKRTKLDFMYAHLKRRSALQRGDRVRTGQKIGQVGETGNAQGCHLHFEVWSAPGWYEGGRALPSVTGLLKTWDRWS